MLLITFAFVLNLISLLANFVAYVTPWMYVNGKFSRGLWGQCYDGRKCTWFFHNDFEGAKHPNMPDWEQAVLALYGLAIIFHAIAFFMALCHVVCCRYRISYTSTVAAILLVVFIMVAISMVIYGVYRHRGGTRFQTSGNHFHAAFYLGIVSAVITLITSMLYACWSGKYY